MKVTPFNPEAQTWWIGRKCICPICNATIELEKGDTVVYHNISQSYASVTAHCPCGGVISVFENQC